MQLDLLTICTTIGLVVYSIQHMMFYGINKKFNKIQDAIEFTIHTTIWTNLCKICLETYATKKKTTDKKPITQTHNQKSTNKQANTQIIITIIQIYTALNTTFLTANK